MFHIFPTLTYTYPNRGRWQPTPHILLIDKSGLTETLQRATELLTHSSQLERTDYSLTKCPLLNIWFLCFMFHCKATIYKV